MVAAGGTIDALADVAGITDDFSPLHETTGWLRSPARLPLRHHFNEADVDLRPVLVGRVYSSRWWELGVFW